MRSVQLLKVFGTLVATNPDSSRGRSAIELPNLARRTRNVSCADARSRFFTRTQLGQRFFDLRRVVAGLRAFDNPRDFAVFDQK